MTQSAAALRGFLIGVTGTILVGATWGAITRPSICCGSGDPLFGAIIGVVAALVTAGLPAGVIGALAVAYIAAQLEDLEPFPVRKPDPHPLDD